MANSYPSGVSIENLPKKIKIITGFFHEKIEMRRGKFKIRTGFDGKIFRSIL